MHAIEFEAFTQKGILKIPKEHSDWYDIAVRVILLPDSAPEPEIAKNRPSEEEIKAFFATKKLKLHGYKFDREEANAR